MFELVFLGTSASAPSVQRGLPSLLIKHEDVRFLVDCGEGTQRQILKTGIGFRKLNRILITHSHLDHILGLAGLLSTFMRWESIDRVEIFGSRPTLERVSDLLNGVVLRGAQPPIELLLNSIRPGLFLDLEDFTVSAFPVQHRGSSSLGFAFQEKGRRPFLPERAEALGIPAGPWRRDLVNGLTALLPDGREISPDLVLGDYRRGSRLVVVGDTGETDSLEEACRGADALVIESTYLEEEADMARDFSHLTARQAATLAARVGVHQLILTHISRRYREKDVLQEAQAVFPNVSVARDFDHFQVKSAEEDQSAP